ncbi:MAG: hypothetical protein AB7U75_03100 [Hyphomicrobiaceae bacterium]
MAPRAKAKKAAASGSSTVRPVKGKAASPGDAATLEAECRALRAELAEAREEIARLEKRQELVVNRIDWVIDSLHNLLEDEG